MQPNAPELTATVLAALDAAHSIAPMGTGKRAQLFASFPRMHGATVYREAEAGTTSVHVHGLDWSLAAVLPSGGALPEIPGGRTYNRHEWRSMLRAKVSGIPSVLSEDAQVVDYCRGRRLNPSVFLNSAEGAEVLEALAAVAPACAPEQTRYAINGVKVEQREYYDGGERWTIASATDGRRFHLAGAPGEVLASMLQQHGRKPTPHLTDAILPLDAVNVMLRWRKLGAFRLEWSAQYWRATVTMANGCSVEAWGDCIAGRFPECEGLRSDSLVLNAEGKEAPELWKVTNTRSVAKRLRELAQVSPELQAVDITDNGSAGVYVRPVDVAGASFDELADAVALNPGKADWRTFNALYLADALQCCGTEVSVLPGMREEVTKLFRGQRADWTDHPAVVIGPRACACLMPISRV